MVNNQRIAQEFRRHCCNAIRVSIKRGLSMSAENTMDILEEFGMKELYQNHLTLSQMIDQARLAETEYLAGLD